MGYIMLIDLQMFNHPFIMGISHLIVVNDFFLMDHWIQFANMLFKIYLFILERKRAWVGGAEGEGENLKQTPQWVQSWMQGPISWSQPGDHDPSQNQELAT